MCIEIATLWHLAVKWISQYLSFVSYLQMDKSFPIISYAEVVRSSKFRDQLDARAKPMTWFEEVESSKTNKMVSAFDRSAESMCFNCHCWIVSILSICESFSIVVYFNLTDQPIKLNIDHSERWYRCYGQTIESQSA